MYSKVKLFGHPIHPMLVAYAIAFYTSTFVGFIIYAVANDHFWLRLTIAANAAAVVMAMLALRSPASSTGHSGSLGAHGPRPTGSGT